MVHTSKCTAYWSEAGGRTVCRSLPVGCVSEGGRIAIALCGCQSVWAGTHDNTSYLGALLLLLLLLLPRKRLLQCLLLYRK